MADKLISDETLTEDDSRIQLWLGKDVRKPPEPLYRRVFVYQVDDKPPQTYPYHYRLLPREVVIELYREQENAPWRIRHASVRGPRICKGDRVTRDVLTGRLDVDPIGRTDVVHSYSCSPDRVADSAAPEWFEQLVDRTYQRAERERISTTTP